MKKGTLIVIAVIVIIALWAFSSYNGMVSQQETATTALANLQSTYQRRADMMPQLVKIVKAYAKHEKETFEEVTKARSEVGKITLDAQNMTPEKVAAYQKAQGDLASAMGKLIAVSERYPDLKANENFQNLQIQEEGTENRVNEARQKYNEAVQNYNITIRRFPNNMVAGMFGFSKMVKFEAEAGADKAPDLDI
jgi:LemA protein